MITVKQAATAYRKMNAASLPPLTAVCQALAAIDQQLDESLHHLGHQDERWRDELLQAQQFLFELMAMTDASSVEGERLLTLYIYVNQTLVTASLKANADAIAEVQEIVRSLHADWQHAQRKQMMTPYI
ncbi:flagellar protein FliS [Sporosarcina jeotgali]|uniref:Flagellar protein FliS n=1 Tax=Sporosarcina jeotgali TaxID=3020056 RepID=A0ABZ0KXN6_9BACL|nr:flagellar protein FliS [Sporosarcina sp. B2O-1]WOV84990.1 flagellar protein FliS [Sporosarcina sp. B2O-1]